MICVNCGKTDRETQLFPLESSMSPDLKACAACMRRFGPDVLASEADKILASLKLAKYVEPEVPHCIMPGCDNPVLLDMRGQAWLYCQACDAKRRRLAYQT